jgi:hypothetical protein
MGDQVRGYGYDNDGAVDSLTTFVNNVGFSDLVSASGFPFGPGSLAPAQNVVKFLLAFDSNMKPIVGQQIALTSSNAAVVGSRIGLLVARANAGDCDLVVKGRWGERRPRSKRGPPGRTPRRPVSGARRRSYGHRRRIDLTGRGGRRR